MITTIYPNGAISESCIKFKYKRQNDYYIVDDTGNRWKVNEKEYMNVEVEERYGKTNRVNR